MPAALDLMLPLLQSFPGFRELEAVSQDRRVLDVEFRLHTPSHQASSFASALMTLDRSVRRATALLDSREFRADGGAPIVPPSIGGLLLSDLTIGSAHLRATPHGLTRTKFLAAGVLMATLSGLPSNLVNDYLAPHLPLLQARETPDPAERHSRHITITLPDGRQVHLDVPQATEPWVDLYPRPKGTVEIVMRTADGQEIRVEFPLR